LIFLRKLHKWLSLAIGLQVLVWVVTGSLMSLLDAPTANGVLSRQALPEGLALARYDTVIDPGQLPIESEEVRSIVLGNLLSQLTYSVTLLESSLLFDAHTGLPLYVDQGLATRIAVASYRGEGRLLGTQLLEQGSDELRGMPGALWRIDFSDPLNTRVYVSSEDGQVLAHRTDRWEIFEFLLMLHFMDYMRVDSFNNPQIIGVAFTTLWLAFSGLILVYYSFSFKVLRWQKRKEN
jgi:Na+-transporting NADH:ubiquinone oxidoreductase subunit F